MVPTTTIDVCSERRCSRTRLRIKHMGCLPTQITVPDWAFKVIFVLQDPLSYVVNYDTIVQTLDGAVVRLGPEKTKVLLRLKEEKGRYGREIYDEVIKWVDEVDKITSEYNKFRREDDRDHARCSLGFPLNPVKRYRHGKRAEDIKGKVEELLGSAKNVGLPDKRDPSSTGVTFSNVAYQSFESRIENLNDIMAALEDSRARMVGVHGPSGVGKTTLVIEAAKMARKKGWFNLVIMANMTKSTDIRKIQGQIADMLGMKLEEESEQGRAFRIRERLKKEKENTLIILDDLSAVVDLNMLGIPSSDSSQSGDRIRKNLKDAKSTAPVPGVHYKRMETKKKPGPGEMKTEKPSGASPSSKLNEEEHYTGCKVLLISEVRHVLYQMNVDESQIVAVNVLNDMDAETLFKTMAGIEPRDDRNSEFRRLVAQIGKEAETWIRKKAGLVDKNSEFGKLAAQIAKKCNGLPMSIVTTARALKSQIPSIWAVTLRDLESQKLTGIPEYSTKLSYNLLQNEELKITFLLCAQMGHDALVMDLVKYCIGLGFLEGVYTVGEAKDRVQMMFVKLKQSGLLSDSYSSDRFTMSNLVRSAALSIASKESHVFMLTEGKLHEWPDDGKPERYTAIYLQHCDVIEKFSKSINCPRLRVFHLENNDPRLVIPDDFFLEMKELRVLILTGINLSSLPSSIKCLTKLRMLCLEQCTLGEQLSLIGRLENLRILSFSGSDIESLPVELKHLSKLQIFDINNCFKLRVIPPNVISSLTSLEELYMRNTSVQWRFDIGQERRSENASLSELGLLNQLKNLDIQIPSLAHLPRNLFFDKLYSYKIVIGSSNRYLEAGFKMPEKYEMSRFLAIQQQDGIDIHSHQGIKMLFEIVEILLLQKFNSVKDIFYELNLKGFPYLKHLYIVSDSEIRSLISPKNRHHPVEAFRELVSLHLHKLKNMMQICSSSCQLSAPSFGKLKIIKIKLCGQLKNVFLITTVRFLTALETLEVSECNSLKEIVPVETQNAAGCELLTFPELRSLMLQSLPEFIGFSPNSSVPGPMILFDEKVVLSKLERMELSFIPIDQIWIGQSSCFQNLVHLEVNGCWNLKCLLSFSMAKCLENLHSLFISDCEKMGHIFPQWQPSDATMKDNIFPNLKHIKLSSMKSLSVIWNYEVSVGSFDKLDTLIIEKCDKLVNVFPRYTVGTFQSLASLRVTSCRSMKAVFDLADWKRDAPYEMKLQDVHLETLPKLKHVVKWKKGQEGILDMKNLQKIWVQDCDKLENIFQVSVALTLTNLEYLTVWDCFGLREIVAKGEDIDNNTGILFEFPRLTTIKLSELPNIRSFYPGAHEVSCQALKDLSVERCDQLEPFREETLNAQRKSILFPEEVISKLNSMQIESRHVKWSTSYDYQKDNLEELRLSRLNNTEILYYFLHHNPDLKNLWLYDCSFKELVPLERSTTLESVGVVPKVKSLKLTDIPYLESIGFERGAILQRIELLLLNDCPRLETIAPPVVTLTHLTSLEVVDCVGLKYLMSPSTAKSLVQLKSMKVIGCESLEEIVSEQGSKEAAAGEGENAGKADNLVFRQLKTLELVSLKSLKSFCSSKSCLFEFPSLDKVVVSACPKMENFSQNGECTPILQKIYFVHEKEDRWCWEGNLHATIQSMFKNKIFLQDMDSLSVSEHLDLKQAWQSEGGLPKDWFYRLKSLKLVNCEFESYAIPANVLCHLKILKELEVRDCKYIAVIFETDDSKLKGTTFQLKKLTLELLPNVTHVWQQDRQGIPSFRNLQQVTVTYCGKVKMLFPAALARDLKMLEKLELSNCDELLEIVAEEEEAAEGTENFVFPHLIGKDGMHSAVRLEYLPELKQLYVYQCPCLTALVQSWSNLRELYVGKCHGLQRLFTYSTAEMLIYLEEIYVEDCKSMKEIVGKEQDETAAEEIKFERLERIVLEDLSRLECFYSGNATLKLPYKVKVEISLCPLVIFLSQRLIRVESSREIRISDRSNDLVASLLKELVSAVKRLQGMSRLEELVKAVETLQGTRMRLRDKVEEDQRDGREIDYDVIQWLDAVDTIFSEYENFREEDDRYLAGCFLGISFNLAKLYRRRKTVDNIKAKVDKLLQYTVFDNISRREGPPPMDLIFSNVDYQSYVSRTETMSKIMAALENSSARMMGVHGPTGVGKTDLVIEAAKMAHKEKLFDVVIMAKVTKSPDIWKIQGQIADMLGMKLEEESEEGRAVRIQGRLKKQKNTLIILDDLCAKLDLNMLGIPSENYNGCKILLISKEREVLSEMDVEESLIFSVNTLNDEDADTSLQEIVA